jgi:hypothetical protein
MEPTTNAKQPTYEERLIGKDLRQNGDRIIRIARDNWPLETIQGKPFTNFLRKLLLTKYKTTYRKWREKGGCQISFSK